MSKKRVAKRRAKAQQKKQNKNILGKLITILQLIASVIAMVIIGRTKMIPVKYMLALGGVLLVLFLIDFGLQFLHSKIGNYIGMIFSLLVMVLLLFVCRYVVKGTQVLEEVSMVEMANALLSGDIYAAIYNEAYTSLIEDSIENYGDQVRVIYEYGIKTEIVQEEKDVTEPFSVYVSGIDVEGEISTTSRSDVNIIMTVNPQTKKILLTTTPRDYYVTIPNVSGDARDKLTHAGIYGVDASIATLENLYNTDISYYARVNFTSVIEIVDALGGVDVNSEYDFTTTHGGQHIVQGMNHMDGETALGFARERYSFTDGDNQRGRNQEALIEAIINKTLSPAILTSADQILASVGGYVETNMTCLIVPNVVFYMFWRKQPEMKYAKEKLQGVLKRLAKQM